MKVFTYSEESSGELAVISATKTGGLTAEEVTTVLSSEITGETTTTSYSSLVVEEMESVTAVGAYETITKTALNVKYAIGQEEEMAAVIKSALTMTDSCTLSTRGYIAMI